MEVATNIFYLSVARLYIKSYLHTLCKQVTETRRKLNYNPRLFYVITFSKLFHFHVANAGQWGRGGIFSIFK
uniref:Uncharacterized protein n=1 Tax=Haplochromis burtoni TaxID=8153 RepID=A0A3Q2V1S0_HAPBU